MREEQRDDEEERGNHRTNMFWTDAKLLESEIVFTEAVEAFAFRLLATTALLLFD